MIIQRCAHPRPSSAHQIIFRVAAIAYKCSTFRTAPLTCRPFNSGSPLQFSSKRKLQTATAYRPHSPDSLPVPPPPPRNTGVPESSIASAAVPEVNDTRPPASRQQPQQQISVTQDAPHSSSPFSSSAAPAEREGHEEEPEPPRVTTISEGEAQRSIPVTPSNNTTPSKSQPKSSRLRPRKAAMGLTPSAVAQLRALLSRPNPKMIRVGVKNRGCSGLAYHLEYVDRAGAFDETVEQDGVKVLIDSKALFSIIGSEMDWVEDKLNQRFVFRNPNISKFFLPFPPPQYISNDKILTKNQKNRRTMRLWRIIHGLAYFIPSLPLSSHHSFIPLFIHPSLHQSMHQFHFKKKKTKKTQRAYMHQIHKHTRRGTLFWSGLVWSGLVWVASVQFNSIQLAAYSTPALLLTLLTSLLSILSHLIISSYSVDR